MTKFSIHNLLKRILEREYKRIQYAEDDESINELINEFINKISKENERTT